MILAAAVVLGVSLPAAASQGEYTVKKGDTLWGIAQIYNTTFMKLAEINSIENPNLIFPGQVLKTTQTVETVKTPENTAQTDVKAEETAKPEKTENTVETSEETTISSDKTTDVFSYIDTEFSEQVMDKISSLGDNTDVGNRSAGSPAEKEAADFIYSTMKEIGLSNVTIDTFTCDNWTFEKGRLYFDENDYISLGGYATNLVCDMEPVSVVYCGKGTAADFENVDIEGKIALIEIDQYNEWWINHPAYEAYLNGAKAVIAYNYAGYAQYSDTTIGVQDICGPDYAPALAINKQGFDKLKSLIDENGGEAQVTLDVKSVVEKDGTSQNVWGEIPGKSDETIMLIAHYDGYFHSAYDDASGVATILGIAKAIKDSGYEPEKTIRIICHGAEEWGKSNTEYDWAKGAYEQITKIHPEWADTAFALLNVDGMYPISGQKDFAIATVYELNSFTQEAIKPIMENYPQYNVEVLSPTSTGTEDFAYSQAGIAAIVASDVDFERSNYEKYIYHTSMDSKEYGYNPEVFKMVHELFTNILLELDNSPVRPLNFTTELNALEESLNKDITNESHSVYAALNNAKDAAAVLDEKIKSGEIENSVEFNQKTAEIFRDIRQNFVTFTWESEIIFPAEQCQNNIEALTAAIEALKDGNGDLAYDEYLYNVDYNWYAYDFSKEAYSFQLSRITDNSVGTWGNSLIINPPENLYDVISFLGENYGKENVDYTEVISVLEEALERQYTYLDSVLAEETNNLNDLAEKMNALAQ